MRRRAALAGLLWLCPAAARATYSIAAVDQSAGAVGGAGTSCVGRLDVAVIYGSVPGVGVVHAQALLSAQGRERAVAGLEAGDAPEQIVLDLTRAGFDRDFSRRQYGIVTLDGAVAAFTGANTGPWAGHETGQLTPFTFSVQGNLLTGPAVLTQARAAFEAGGCDLADRLMRALEAGRDNGEGDARCTPRGVPADSAFIRVDPGPGGAPLALSVVDTGNQDPVTLLRAQYDAWRAEHPCPAPPDAGVEPDAEAPEAGGRDAEAGGADAQAPPDAARDASETDVAPDASAADAEGAEPAVRGTIGGTCQAVGPQAPGLWALLAVVVVARPRRRRASCASRAPRPR